MSDCRSAVSAISFSENQTFQFSFTLRLVNSFTKHMEKTKRNARAAEGEESETVYRGADGKIKASVIFLNKVIIKPVNKTVTGLNPRHCFGSPVRDKIPVFTYCRKSNYISTDVFISPPFDLPPWKRRARPIYKLSEVEPIQCQIIEVYHYRAG